MSQTTSAKLRASLERITNGLAALIKGVPVMQVERSYDVIVVAPNFYWGEVNAHQRSAQLAIKRDFDGWIELLKIAVKGAPEDVMQELQTAEENFRIWIELDSNWSLTPHPTQNEQKLCGDVRKFEEILSILDANATSGVILVPDTNAIIKEPDPAKYRATVAANDFTFLLLPTILSELDSLKNLHKNPDFRDKAEKVVTRIKGWRKQGSQSGGVTVDGTIIVKAAHSEPDMESTLSWLDADVPDDRIIASLLEIQSANPTCRVVLVTGDINLQNKADAASVEHIELL
jgi:hypothetical protein